MSVSEQKIPRRVLIIDDDATLRAAATTLLKSANLEAVSAADGEEALTLFARQWFPVIVTGRKMPLIDGIELVQRVRAFAVAPVYIIMLTEGADSQDYEHGYCAGVDHYLPKQSYEAELVARVTTGMFAIRRRQTTGVARNDGPVIVDLKSGAHTARHLVGRLHAEIAHAARQSKPLTVLTVCIEVADRTPQKMANANFEAASEALLDAVQDAVRAGRDWIARLPTAPNVCRLAIVMPGSGSADVSTVEQNIRNTFVRIQDAKAALQLSIGAAAVSAEARPTALDLLGESERNRRELGARTEPEASAANASSGGKGDDVEQAPEAGAEGTA